MPAIATASSLSNYSKLNIAAYRDQLRLAEKVSSIDLTYSYRGKDYSYSVQLTKSSCNYGHHRYWWSCPKCSKRVGMLYCAGIYVCRHCIGTNYQTQLQQPIDRIYNKLNVIRARMGWQVGVIHGIGERPKGMHNSTYKRLLNEYEQLTDKLLRTFNQ